MQNIYIQRRYKMEAETIINLVSQYAPTIIATVCIVITTLMQKSNLFSGLKTLYQKADEFNKSAQFKEIQDKMTTLTVTIKEQEQIIKELTDSVRKIHSSLKE